MNDYDQKIFEYLKEVTLIESNRAYYDEYEDTYQEAKKALKDKLFSDINTIDDNGNTFLHIAMEKGLLRQADILLRLGANPSIRNTQGKNSFQLCSKISDFKEKYSCFSLNKDFESSCWGFHDNFKNYIIRAIHYAKFDNKEDFYSFTKTKPYLDKKTYIEIIDFCLGLNNTQKIEIFLEGKFNEEENTLFLSKISKKIYTKLNPSSLEAYQDLLEKDFADNKNLHEAVKHIMAPKNQLSDKSEKLKVSVMELMIDKLLSGQYDLNRKMKYSENTLDNFLSEHVKELYLSKKLHNSLDIKEKNKPLKI